MKYGAEAFVLFLRGAWLVLRSSVLTVLDLNKVDVTLENAEIFGLVLSGEGGSAGGSWCVVQLKCSWSPQLPHATPKNPPPFITSLLIFVLAEMGATITTS